MNIFSHNIFQVTFFNNTLREYTICLLLFFAGLVFVKVVLTLVIKRIKVLTEKTETTLDDFIITTLEKQCFPVLYASALYLSLKSLLFPPMIEKGINAIMMVIVAFYAVGAVMGFIGYMLEQYWMGKEQDESKKGAMKGIMTLIRLLVWGLAIVILCDNLGIKISAVITGLGIGGIAIALAAQAVLGDLFSYFTIFFDKPFQIGDFIVVGDNKGTVEHIGIKTTRISSVSGEQLIMSNSLLTGSCVKNFKRMAKRRIVFNVGIKYETPQDKLKEIPEIIKKLVSAHKDVTFDRSHFTSFGDFSLNFETVYFVNHSDYARYMDIQQDINLKLKEELEKRDVQFAYPTQLVIMSK